MTATERSTPLGVVPVLWLYGPPGVGKSTIAWELFTRLSEAGRRVGYVDLDQVGICYGAPRSSNWVPEPRSDVGRHRLQALNLDATLPHFAAAGAEGIVVSGVVDRQRGADAALLPRAALTAVRLRVDRETLRRRLERRGRPDEDLELARRYADALDRLTGPVLDTGAEAVDETVRRVQNRIGGWPDLPSGPADRFVEQAPAQVPVGHSAAGELLWLCGPTAVGKSTIGWQAYQEASRSGLHTAFVDLQQIGFLRPAAPDDLQSHRLKARNLAVVRMNFRAAGAHRLVIVGSLESEEALSPYLAALPSGALTVCRLRAGDPQLSARVASRGRGQGPQIAGDMLRGQPPDVLDRAAERAKREAARLDRAAFGDFWVDTDDKSPLEVAREILYRAGWARAGSDQSGS